MQLRIHNIRLGFATNSSSDHSIAFFPNHGLQDREIDGSFGGDDFVAVSDNAKKLYLAAMLRENFNRQFKNWDSQWTRIIIKELLEVDINQVEDMHMDHQSLITLPLDPATNDISFDFAKQLIEMVRDPSVVIFGGSDNNVRNTIDDFSTVTKIEVPFKDLGDENLVCRYDERYHFWTLFNKNTGAKIRFSFENVPGAVNPEKSSVPDLLDCAITNRCFSACPFCLKNSTHNGSHADYNYISSMIYYLSKMKIFEISFGGGEPTLHPKFVDILSCCKNYNIIPNFTTRQIDWMEDPIKIRTVMDLCGSFALSVKAEYGDIEKVARATAILRYHKLPVEKMSINIVMGTIDQYFFKQLMEELMELGIRKMTLLGFKNVGRGLTYRKIDYDWLVGDLAENYHKYPSIGIDTVLAAEMQDQLRAAGVNNVFYTVQEGKHSMYLDAVKRKIGPSSYCDPALMISLPEYDADGFILSRYAEW